MNWEIILVLGIAVLGWMANHWLAIRAQNKSLRNQILNSARLDITKAIRDYEDWLLRFQSSVEGVSYAIVFQEQGFKTDWAKTTDKVRNELYSDKSVINWVCRLEEYELLFTVTQKCRQQLIKNHNQIHEVINSFVRELILPGIEPEALEHRKKVLKEADKNQPLIYDQLALMEDLLIYLQNYSLSPITGKEIPEREPKDPSLPRLCLNKQGYLQYKEGTEQN